MKKAIKEVFLLSGHHLNGIFTLHGTGTRSGTGIGNGMNGFRYSMQKCSHWSETEAGTRILCFLLCQSNSLYCIRSRSRAVWISHYSSCLFPGNFTVNYRTKKSWYSTVDTHKNVFNLGNWSKWCTTFVTFVTLFWTGNRTSVKYVLTIFRNSPFKWTPFSCLLFICDCADKNLKDFLDLTLFGLLSLLKKEKKTVKKGTKICDSFQKQLLDKFATKFWNLI